MVNKKQFCEFLVKAKKATYAAGEKAKKIIKDDKSTTLIFKEGNWKYQDNYFGGESFGGREIVFFKNEPVYFMGYYGLVNNSIINFEMVYKILKKALLLIPKNKPFRGPSKYINDDLIYTNKYNGKIENFFGEEIITMSGRKIYTAKYMGGFINQRK